MQQFHNGFGRVQRCEWREAVVLCLLGELQTMFRNNQTRSPGDLRRLSNIECDIKASPWASKWKVIAEIQRLRKSL